MNIGTQLRMCAVLLLLCGGAQAADQFDLTVSGRIIAGTCELSPGEASKDVPLEDVKSGDFDNGTVPEKSFSIALSNCDADEVKFTFTGDSEASDPWYFAHTGNAKGVATKLSSRIGGVTEVVRADGSNSGNIRTIPVSGNAASLEMVATYHRLAEPLEPGPLTTLISVQLDYL